MKKNRMRKAVMLLNSKEEASELISLISSMEINLDITIAGHADQLVSTVSSEEVECFILDWNYAPYSAIELADNIRKNYKYRKTPIVFVTDKKDISVPTQYSSLRVDLVIHRPFIAEDFNVALKETLDKNDISVIPKDCYVLILDDNPNILEIMVDYMRELKHIRFETCHSIAGAKKLVAENDFDLFLLDWDLDDGTCIDLIPFIRTKKSDKRLNDTLIMAITGRESVYDIMTMLTYNVKDYIIKPFNYLEFEEKIIYALERHKKVIG